MANSKIPYGPLKGHTLIMLRSSPHPGHRAYHHGWLDGRPVTKTDNPRSVGFKSRRRLMRAAVEMLGGTHSDLYTCC